ncbi:uncharacterized protein DNG_05034 [Cephalotrichum gorgonifer]|uniref:Protein kinase domain-containing protein n=1 Tax=Cephalotrichum gorgonifer TaxID=2041049 RepID=A0AAE8MX46_9PEZI|nr:uncharacterized protein DNG_05034 [Cephalotrichum gorgonifer]
MDEWALYGFLVNEFGGSEKFSIKQEKDLYKIRAPEPLDADVIAGSWYEARYLAENISELEGKISQHQQEITRIPLSDSFSIIDVIREHLEEAKVDSVYQDQVKTFIPCKKLYTIMNEESVRQALHKLKEATGRDLHPPDGEFEKWVAQISPPILKLGEGNKAVTQFRRTFAALILVGKADSIFDFINQEVNDEEMCLANFDLPAPSEESEERANQELQCAYDRFPVPCRNMVSWPKKYIRAFRSVRWEVSPPFFSTETSDKSSKLVHYELRSPDEVLPFTKGNRGPVKEGGSSQLEFYCVHESQQDLPRYTTKGKAHPVAVKRLEDKRAGQNPWKQSDKFENERYVLDRLTLAEGSPHIVKLLATFKTPGMNCTDKYHFMFEAADGTIEKLWNDEDLWREHSPGAVLSRWVARQCHGLAEGLAHVHQFPKSAVDDNPKTRGMHGDIKPGNILWYKDWILDNQPNPSGAIGGSSSEEEPFGILQIADFGVSSFHSTMTVDQAPLIGFSMDYTPPETEIWSRHLPPSDVWQLGCLLLDFATWLVTGPRGYDKFKKARSSQGLRMVRPRFSTFEQVKKNLTHVTVNPEVWKHANNLHKHNNTSPFVRDLVDLVVNHMLVVEDLESLETAHDTKRTKGSGRRISSREAKGELKKMFEAENDNAGYYSPSSPTRRFNVEKRDPLKISGTKSEIINFSDKRHWEEMAKWEASEA